MSIETNLIINGEWRPALSGKREEIRNPANTDEVVGYNAWGGREDARLAIEAAHCAFPKWASLSCRDRAAYLIKIVDRLVENSDDLQGRIRLFTREHGKILKESQMEMTRLGDRFRYGASLADRLAQDERLSAPPLDTIITKQPRGVAALIIPWNWPLSILGGKLPQALLAGNTVVIKPAPQSPLAPSLTIKIMADTLPPGVINLVNGPPAEVGEELLTNRMVRRVDFTGGIETGKHVMRMAASTLKHITLELGGNDPAVILEDAVLDEAAFQRIVMGSFLTTGQVCMAIKRIYAHRSIYKTVVDGFTDLAAKYIIGDGLNPEVTMGPLNDRNQLSVVQRLVGDAKNRGARVNSVGRYQDESAVKRGYFHLPTVITEIDPAAPVVVEEQFGPLMPIILFDKEEDAIRMANDTEFGLCSSVWTQDRERAIRIARQLEAGYTYFNAHGPMAQDNRAPFGGVKQSGIGRNLGYEGVLEYVEYHSMSGPAGWLL